MTLTAPRVLAGIAIGLGVLAAIVGSPMPSVSRTTALDVPALAKTIEHEDDHVTALELAQWIRDRKPGLRVIDVRTPAEFADDRIPTAERADLDALATLSFAPDETVVLYSAGGAHAAQGWIFLRARGLTRVYFLRNGFDDWLDDVMAPTLAEDAAPEARAAFAHASELSHYFGGHPRVGVSAGDAARPKRHGC